jgi:four helix bundle protein
MSFAFERLLVYQKSVDFADAICATTEEFQRGYGFLVDQLNRAALSISSNIAESNGRFTVPDRKHFFGIARGSVQECVPQLEIAKRRGLLSTFYSLTSPIAPSDLSHHFTHSPQLSKIQSIRMRFVKLRLFFHEFSSASSKQVPMVPPR